MPVTCSRKQSGPRGAGGVSRRVSARLGAASREASRVPCPNQWARAGSGGWRTGPYPAVSWLRPAGRAENGSSEMRLVSAPVGTERIGNARPMARRVTDVAMARPRAWRTGSSPKAARLVGDACQEMAMGEGGRSRSPVSSRRCLCGACGADLRRDPFHWFDPLRDPRQAETVAGVDGEPILGAGEIELPGTQDRGPGSIDGIGPSPRSARTRRSRPRPRGLSVRVIFLEVRAPRSFKQPP